MRGYAGRSRDSMPAEQRDLDPSVVEARAAAEIRQRVGDEGVRRGAVVGVLPPDPLRERHGALADVLGEVGGAVHLAQVVPDADAVALRDVPRGRVIRMDVDDRGALAQLAERGGNRLLRRRGDEREGKALCRGIRLVAIQARGRVTRDALGVQVHLLVRCEREDVHELDRGAAVRRRRDASLDQTGPRAVAHPARHPHQGLDLCLGVGSAETEIETLMRVTGRMGHGTGSGLIERGVATPPYGGAPVQFVDVFPLTPDQKVNLYPEGIARDAPAGLYGYQADPATERFPLALISPATEKSISSTLGELRERAAVVHIHPDDAAPRNIAQSDGVRVWNDLGEMHCPANLTQDIRQGTVSFSKGVWRKNTYNGSTSNALVPDSLTDLGGGACFNDARVQVCLLYTSPSP